MSNFLKVPSLDRLSHELSKLPGIGAKTAERLALSLIKRSIDDVELLREALIEVKTLIKECSNCYSYTEDEDICAFCSDDQRRHHPLVCVVKSPTDIGKIESSGAFKGTYHVLHGCIAPLDGVGPEDIRLEELVQRIRKRKGTENPVQEVIVALDSNLEGDTTALYLKERLEEEGVQTSRLAHGVPMGSYMDFVDQRTLGKALENRIKI
jgi:recombination protein RecR